jgi:aminoglycoside phosphotransferase (APT) family kinase protein
MITLTLSWQTASGYAEEALIVRRYRSTVSWWRPDDRGKAQREATVLRWLRTAGLPVPDVYAREFGAFGDIVLLSRLPGQGWSALEMPFPAAVRPHVGAFAGLLARLHALRPPEDVRSVVPQVTLVSALAGLQVLAQQIGDAELAEIVDQVMDDAYLVEDQQPCIVHGDYHFANVLLHQGRISGLLDWEYCALADPRWDVASAYMQLVDFDAAEAADEFLTAYLRTSGRRFEGPPLFNVVVPLQQWVIAEWLIREQQAGRTPSFRMAHELIALRDTHRSRALRALTWLHP